MSLDGLWNDTRSDRAAALTNKAIHDLGKGYVEPAADKLLRAVEADPTYGPAHNTLGLMHYRQQNYFQAVTAFRTAIEVMPENTDARYNLALALEAAGRVDEAAEIYGEIVSQYPSNPHYLGNLVRLKLRRGETGPEIEWMLRDLVLVETRPNWRRWADRLLALDRNDALDRGPPAPDFNTASAAEAAEQMPLEEKIIDLSPEPGNLTIEGLRPTVSRRRMLPAGEPQ